MTRIDGIQQIVAMLQATQASRPERPGGGPLNGSTVRGGRKAEAGAGPEATLAEHLRVRLAAIDRADPESERKMLRVFLESVLTAKFGEALTLDPAFSRMVDDIQQQMESSHALVPLVKEALAALTGQA